MVLQYKPENQTGPGTKAFQELSWLWFTGDISSFPLSWVSECLFQKDSHSTYYMLAVCCSERLRWWGLPASLDIRDAPASSPPFILLWPPYTRGTTHMHTHTQTHTHTHICMHTQTYNKAELMRVWLRSRALDSLLTLQHHKQTVRLGRYDQNTLYTFMKLQKIALKY